MPDGGLPTVALLATGGTIAGAQTGAASGAYRAGTLPAAELLAAVPGVDALARLQPEQVANVGSQDISLDIWSRLAGRVAELCADPAVDGIVITHGTDTLEETAYFLSLVLPAACGRRPGQPVPRRGACRRSAGRRPRPAGADE